MVKIKNLASWRLMHPKCASTWYVSGKALAAGEFAMEPGATGRLAPCRSVCPWDGQDRLSV